MLRNLCDEVLTIHIFVIRISVLVYLLGSGLLGRVWSGPSGYYTRCCQGFQEIGSDGGCGCQHRPADNAEGQNMPKNVNSNEAALSRSIVAFGIGSNMTDYLHGQFYE